MGDGRWVMDVKTQVALELFFYVLSSFKYSLRMICPTERVCFSTGGAGGP